MLRSAGTAFFCAILLLAACASSAQEKGGAVDAEAAKIASHFWSTHFVRCGASYYSKTYNKGDYAGIVELKGLNWSVRPLPTAQVKGEGVQWFGVTTVKVQSSRLHPVKGEWGTWQPGVNPPVPDVRLLKMKGQWGLTPMGLVETTSQVLAGYRAPKCSEVPK